MQKSLPVITLLICAAPAFAAQWQFVPRIGGDVGYESNAALIDSGEEVDGISTRLTGEIDIRRETERTDVYFRPAVRVERFEKRVLQPLDNESWFLDTGIGHQGERSDLGVRLRYTEQPVFRSELDTAIPDDPDDPLLPGSGELSVLEDTQQRLNVRPYWNYALTQKDSLRVFLRYLDVSYDEAANSTGRLDFQDALLSVEWAHDFGPRQGLRIGVSGGDYSADNPDTQFDNQTKYLTGTVGYQWALSETSTLRANVGSTLSDVTLKSPNLCTDPGDILLGEPCKANDDTSNFVYDVSWRKRSELTSLNLSFGQFVAPTSRGSQQKRIEARAYVNRRFSPKLTGTFGLVGNTQSGLRNGVGFDRDYFTMEFSGDWQFTRKFFATASYRYTLRQGDAEFDNHWVRVGIEWRGLRRP